MALILRFVKANINPDGSIGQTGADSIYTTALAARALVESGVNLGTAIHDFSLYGIGDRPAGTANRRETDSGTTHVLVAGPEFKVLGQNTLDEMFWASPAVAAGAVFLRSIDHLYCIQQ